MSTSPPPPTPAPESPTIETPSNTEPAPPPVHDSGLPPALQEVEPPVVELETTAPAPVVEENVDDLPPAA